jgi:predicted oxidoreductase
MQKIPFGPTDVTATRLIYGCMRVVGTWNPREVDAAKKGEAFAAFDAALDAGYTHFDHADIYCRGMCEAVFGEWLAANPGVRERLVITTKCGIRWPEDPAPGDPHRYDFSKDYILWSCDESLKRMGIDTIDIYLLHRPDVLMNPPEIAAAFGQLQQAGKVRHFGVSNFTATQFEDLQSALDQPLVCNQLQIHPGRLEPIEDGTLNAMRRLGVVPTAWSPIGGGKFGDGPLNDKPEVRRVQEALDAEAKALGVSRTAVTLAWLMKHPSGVQPIVGSRDPQRIRDAATACSIELSRETWYRIYLACRGEKLP